MIFTAERTDGERLEVALDAARGDGVAVHVAEHLPPDVLDLSALTALILQRHPEAPSFYVAQGRIGRYIACRPDSTLELGYEDPTAPVGSNAQRHASMKVGELASVSLDLDRMTVATGKAGS